MASQPDYVYLLFSTNTLVQPNNEEKLLAYYEKMIDILRENLDPGVIFYVQSIPGVQEDVVQSHPGLDNARIAANSVVLHEVPPDSTVVGVPGRVVRRNGEKLDHIHTPDPVRLELDALYARIEKLEEKLKQEDQDVSL